MSNFAKKFASIRNKIASDRIDVNSPEVTKFLEEVRNAGIDLDIEKGRSLLKAHPWDKLGPYDFFTGAAGNEILSAPNGKAAAEIFKSKVEQWNAALEGNEFYNKLGEDEVNDMVKLLNQKRKGMDAYYVLMNHGQSGSGNKTVQTNPGKYYASLEDEELEKMAKALTEEFGLKVRAMLASLKK